MFMEPFFIEANNFLHLPKVETEMYRNEQKLQSPSLSAEGRGVVAVLPCCLFMLPRFSFGKSFGINQSLKRIKVKQGEGIKSHSRNNFCNSIWDSLTLNGYSNVCKDEHLW